jgi:hypothetical protein
MSSTALTTTQPTSNGFALMMSPATIEAAREFCATLSKTEFVPKAFRGKPDSIMVVGAMGARLGVDVFTAMAGISDINGKPAIYGDLMLAVCQNHPAFLDCVETFEGEPYADTFRAVCIAKRKGREPVTRTFSVIEAKEAQLWKKSGPWTATPQRMLQMRARAFALRDTFSDALAGFHAREELDDLVDVTASVTVHADPRPAAVRALPSDTAGNQAKDNATSQGTTSQSGYVTAEDRADDEAERLAQEAAKNVKDVSVDACKRAMTEAWKRGSIAKERVKVIMAEWKLAEVKDLAGSSDEDRGAFIDLMNAVSNEKAGGQ